METGCLLPFYTKPVRLYSEPYESSPVFSRSISLLSSVLRRVVQTNLNDKIRPQKLAQFRNYHSCRWSKNLTKFCGNGKFISVFTKYTRFVHSLIHTTPTIFGPFLYRPILEVFSSSEFFGLTFGTILPTFTTRATFLTHFFLVDLTSQISILCRMPIMSVIITQVRYGTERLSQEDGQ